MAFLRHLILYGFVYVIDYNVDFKKGILHLKQKENYIHLDIPPALLYQRIPENARHFPPFLTTKISTAERISHPLLKARW